MLSPEQVERSDPDGFPAVANDRSRFISARPTAGYPESDRLQRPADLPLRHLDSVAR